MAEKRWPQEEKSAHNGHEARPRSLKGRESNERNPETGAAGKKNEKTSDALDTGGGACGYNRRHSEPGVVPGHTKWEIPANNDMFVQDVPVIAMWSYNNGEGSDPNSFDMRRNPNASGQAPGNYDATDWGPLNAARFVGGNSSTDFIGGESFPGNAREWAALLVYDHVLTESEQIQVMDFLGNEYGIPSVSSGGPPADQVWTVDASGSWSSVNNWSFGIIPNDNLQTATFGSEIMAPRTVFTESEITVNRIVFDNSNEYVISGNYPINLEASTAPTNPRVDVASGAHQFQTSVNLLSDTVVDVESNATVIFNNVLNLNGHTLTKTGMGELAINNILSTGSGTLNCDEGVCGGSGTIGGGLNNNGGTISPGNSSGNLPAVPEPSAVGMLWLGTIAAAACWRSARRQPKQFDPWAAL